MTIEESICELKYVRKLNERILEDRAKEKDVDNTWIKHWENVVESLNMAIEIMRKYQKIQTRLDGLEHSMECLLESDPRTFADRECENGWLFDKIIEWRKVINEVLKDDNSNLDNSSM